MAGGFLTNAAEVTGINTGYVAGKVVALTSSDTVGNGGANIPLPQSVYIDNLELDVTPTGAVTSLTARITYDAAGDDPMTGDLSITIGAGVTTATVFSGVSVVQMWKRMPGKTLTLYLHLKTNANTAAVGIGGARLHWVSSFTPNVG